MEDKARKEIDEQIIQGIIDLIFQYENFYTFHHRETIGKPKTEDLSASENV
jgi:hypothetical protein